MYKKVVEGEVGVIRLRLNKPREWSCKLSTCHSSPAVLYTSDNGSGKCSLVGGKRSCGKSKKHLPKIILEIRDHDRDEVMRDPNRPRRKKRKKRRQPDGGGGGGGGSGSGRDEMGSNLSKRRSQSSGDLLCGGGGGSGVGGGEGGAGPAASSKLAASLPNHLDLEQPHHHHTLPTPHHHHHHRHHHHHHNNNNNEEDLHHHYHTTTAAGRHHHHQSRCGPDQDQGYASERSPEEERRSPQAPASTAHTLLSFPACPVHHAALIEKYPFINSESTFTVEVTKGSGGLGLSVSGGEPWPGLVRIKRLFPHQPASHSGLLQPGDILLAASGVPLLGLTNYEALEVLRATPSEVKLTVCRPPGGVAGLTGALGGQAPTTEHPPPPPPPPPRDINTTTTYGEFEIWMEKQNGSLGFTLRKEDQSVLGHYVRALVREPALSDTRIRPGDKIIAVNDVRMTGMTHEEAVRYLRQCGSRVKLRLYRDPAQTPLPPMPHSPPPNTTNTGTLGRSFKPILRKEAQDMLSELKKSQTPQQLQSQDSHSHHNNSKGSSPRKRRLTRTPPPLDGTSTPESSRPRRPDNLNFSTDSSQCFHNSPDTTVGEGVKDMNEDVGESGAMLEEEVVQMVMRPLHPQAEHEPASMPPLGTACSISAVAGESAPATGFSYRNPAYRSANPAPSRPHLSADDLLEGGCSEQDIPGVLDNYEDGGGSKGLLKWKGVLFMGDQQDEDIASAAALAVTAVQSGSNNAVTLTQSRSGTPAIDPVNTDPLPPVSSDCTDGSAEKTVNGYKNVMVELNRGWNSRLGFSLQQSLEGKTMISAIYPDSVASRSGKLKVGDILINVNDENIEDMETTDVIDLLRKIRGSICLTLLRKPE